MTHSALHFGLGLWAGAAVLLPPVARAWARGEPLARRTRNWLVASYALAFWAVAPALLRRAGLPDPICDSPPMNLFLFYPLLHARNLGGIVAGGVVLLGAFALQYALLVTALIARRGQQR